MKVKIKKIGCDNSFSVVKGGEVLTTFCNEDNIEDTRYGVIELLRSLEVEMEENKEEQMEPMYIYDVQINPDYDPEMFGEYKYMLAVTTMEYWHENHCMQDHNSDGMYEALEELGIGPESCECSFDIREEDIEAIKQDGRFTTCADFTNFLNQCRGGE